MRVRIYSGLSSRILEDIHFITHKNAVEGLVLNQSDDPDITVEVQAKPGQAFVLSGRFLYCYQAGHFVLDETEQVVWGASAMLEAVS
jgi:hypothetical protein